MKIYKFYIFSLLLVFACSCKNEVKPSQKSESNQDHSIQIVGTVFPTERTFSSDVSITGTAMPFQKVNVHALVSGYVGSIIKDIGDYVQKGGVIAHLKNPEIHHSLKEAEANLKRAEAEIIQAEANRNKWKALSNSKNIILERLESTYKKAPNLVLASDVDNSRGEYESAFANYKSAEAGIAVAKGRKEAAEASLNAMKVRQEMLIVKAPFSGIVTKRYVDNGATVLSGLESTDAMPLVTMQDVSKIRLTVQLPEADAANVSVGNVIKVSFPEVSNEIITAKISRSANTLDPQSKTMQVEIDIDNKDGKLKPGMYAKVIINALSRKGKLTVPVSAKKLIDDVFHLLVVQDGIVKAIRLNQGLEGRDYVEVLNKEITATSQIIIQGKNLVKEGQRVEGIIIED